MNEIGQAYLFAARWIIPFLSVLLIVLLGGYLLKENKKTDNGESFSNSKKVKIKRVKPATHALPLFLLVLIQVLIMSELLFFAPPESAMTVMVCFLALIAVTFGVSILAKYALKSSAQIELTALFLTTIGFSVILSASPGSAYKQLAALGFGIAVYYVLLAFIKNQKIAVKLKYPAAIAAVAFLAVNLAIGTAFNGAKNWIDFGFVTIQPSEFVKVLFVLAAAGTAEWITERKNLFLFSSFSAALVGLLFVMDDFGTALIFFVAYIVAAYLMFGGKPVIAAFIAAIAGGAGIALISPRVFSRFSVWRNVFEQANARGYQQSRTLIALASGGLLGLGGSKGFLRKVSESDTDIVFGIIGEEYGLIVALCAAACIALLFCGSLKGLKHESHTWYAIAACTAAGLMLFQTSLNIFGSTDLLPLTGVTFPFVSNGGSSMIACWGLLAFLKAIYVKKSQTA